MAAPTVPLNLTVVPGPVSGEITATWDAPAVAVPALTGYRLEYCFEPGCDNDANWLDIGTVIGPADLTAPGFLGPTNVGSLRLFAVNADGDSPPTPVVEAVGLGPPSAVLALDALPTAVVDEVELTWDAPATDGGPPITGYVYSKQTDGGGYGADIPTGSALPGVIDICGGISVCDYIVAAVNAQGQGAYAGPVAGVAASLPPPPANLVALTGGLPGEVDLSWDAASDDNGPIVSYEYRTGPDGIDWGAWVPIPGGRVTEWTDDACGSDVVCSYQVRAVNAIGPSEPSNIDSNLGAPGPPPGRCEPWIMWDDIICGCPDIPDVSTVVQQHAIAEAQETLWHLTGEQYGVCTVTLRPCRPCGCHHLPCVCGPYERLRIAREPVVGVTTVRVDGMLLDPSAYRVDDYHYLVRVDGLAWPYCQSMAGDPTAPGVFEVTFTWGTPVPAGLLTAAATLACEIAKACNTTGGPCKISDKATIRNREGVTFAVLDVDLLRAGGTGIVSVDRAVARWGGTLGMSTPVVGMFDPAGA